MNFELLSADSEQDFIEQSTAVLSESIVESIEQKGECILGLSGGSTPKPVYEALGNHEDIDWSKVFIFLVDERHIDSEDATSNQYLVRNTLIANADIPENNLIFPDTSLATDACVADYTKKLIALFSVNPPDIVTLGLGPDGHTASLFPPVAEDHFGEQIVVHTTTDVFDVHDRISISPLVLMAAQSHVLMLRGQEKIDVFNECVASEINPSRWPLHIALGAGNVVVVSSL